MKNIRAITLLSCLLTLMGCTDENTKIRGEFLSGCIQGGGNRSVCSCTFDELEKKYNTNELNSMASSYSRPPDDMLGNVMRFAARCQAEYLGIPPPD